MVDFNAKEGLEDLKPINELLTEFGLRLAFKAIPTNTKDSFGNKAFGVGTETVLEVTKKAARGEVKEEFMKLDKNQKK